MSDVFEPSQDPTGLDAELGPFPKPDGSKVLKWHQYQNPRPYAPFLVEVVVNTKTTLEFFLLDKSTAARAHASALSVEIIDGTRIYQALPSTAQKAVPGDANRCCGFLFLSESYIKELEGMPAIGPAVIVNTRGTGKWPKGSAALATALRKLLAQPEHRNLLSPEEAAAVQGLLATLA